METTEPSEAIFTKVSNEYYKERLPTKQMNEAIAG